MILKLFFISYFSHVQTEGVRVLIQHIETVGSIRILN
jgi:hypothetical protein